jgi:glutathione S-transferase
MYIADLAPSTELAPAMRSFARYDLFRWLSFVGTELHKQCLAPMFGASTPEAVKTHAREAVHRPLRVAEQHLCARESLLGSGFSVADAYLWWALTLLQYAKVPFDAYPSLRAFYLRHLARPAVAAALSYERAQHARAFPTSVPDAQPNP